jgi:hypothetical protein
MCTLSFIPNSAGYVAAVNRDEQFSRTCGLPPKVFGNAIYPHEPDGGTWVAVNSSGLTLAILNRNQSGALPIKSRSRGELIPALISADSLAEIHRQLVEIGFQGMWPFRLIAFSAQEQEVCEWAWSKGLTRSYYEWQSRHWYSSGMSDTEAQNIRGAVVEQAWKQPSAGTLEWARELHKSHEPEPGAFSICVHRPDAATVSYSEIVVEPQQVRLSYSAGSPCTSTGFDSVLSLPVRSLVGFHRS